MEEPQTHYQVSLTSRQAVAVFVVLVALLVGSYFLGLLTGLSSGRRERLALASTAPTPAASEPSFPAPVLGVSGRGARQQPTAAPTSAPAPEAPAAVPTAGVQLFSDRPSSEPTAQPARSGPAPHPTLIPSPARAAAKPVEASGFWLQVDSLSSKTQAETRRSGLARAGYKAAIVPGTGAKGTVYRVRVGPYATREEAERAAPGLERKTKIKPWVVPPGQ